MYLDSQAEIPSKNHVLFIEKSVPFKKQVETIKCQYSKFGMNFGFLGKRAVLYIDHSVLRSDNDRFRQYSKYYKEKINQYTVKNYFTDATVKTTVKDTSSDVLGIDGYRPHNRIVSSPIQNIDFRALKKIKKDEQLLCLVQVVYLEWLQKFLEN